MSILLTLSLHSLVVAVVSAGDKLERSGTGVDVTCVWSGYSMSASSPRPPALIALLSPLWTATQPPPGSL